MDQPPPPPALPGDSAPVRKTSRCFRWRPGWLVLGALLITLAGPFLLQPEEASSAAHYDRRLVILSPHNERVRREIGRAFVEYWHARTGETVYLDWRLPGGASEIALFLKSEFAGAFQHYWEAGLQRPWSPALATGFADPRIALDDDIERASIVAEARRTFLDSSIGVGVDLLFGGGSYDFQQQAEAGYLSAGSVTEGTGLAAIIAQHPGWFSPAGIPAEVSGEPFRDREHRWAGVVLASFGIVYNRDVLARLRIGSEPAQWSDLTDPRLAGQVALADPGKSGSAAKAFELIIQQQMHQAVARLTAKSGDNAEVNGVRQGWLAGLRLIQRISANARYFTDSASKIPLEVTRGDAAAGMAIDAYGRAAEEYVRRPDGRSRVGFIAPMGGTSVSVDPIAMLRGAPEPGLATAFMEFVLSTRGQKLWAFRPGAPEGPVAFALRRLPVRRDFYIPEHGRYMTDAAEQPFAKAAHFVYHPAWTGPAFDAIRFLIRVLCVDNHIEQRRAWRAMIDHGLPADAMAAFHDLEGLGHDEVLARIVPVLRARDKVAEVRLARKLGAVFRERYERAYRLAMGRGGSP